MRIKTTLLLTLFIIIAVSAATFGACSHKRSAPGAAAPATALLDAPRRTLPPLPSRPLSTRLAALGERAMADASAARGLGWRGQVGMTELTGWEYGTRTKEVADVLGTDDLAGLSRLAVAGGMLPEGTDLASLAVSFTAASAGATYSPLDKQVLIVAEKSKTRAEEKKRASLLTHEFVHALQDQHFDLLRLMMVRPFDFDRTEALFALVEGDAMSVERRVQLGEAFARLSLDEVLRQEDARYSPYRRGIGALFPPLLTETFIFRYRDGLHFVETMRRERPETSLDELFRRPPATSEQVLHPEKYLSGEAARDVSLNTSGLTAEGWRLAAATPLGEIGVRGVLMSGVTPDEARRAAAGWGGDRAYVFEREGLAPLFVWRTVWDRERDAREFFDAYNALLYGRGGRRSSGASEPGAARREWRERGLRTIVFIEGDAVTVVRGAETDAPAAFDKLLRR